MLFSHVTTLLGPSQNLPWHQAEVFLGCQEIRDIQRTGGGGGAPILSRRPAFAISRPRSAECSSAW
jgi:hypothetical protein